jgi:hypothetical protein
MHLAVMSPAQWHGELIADFAPERQRLRKAQVVGISRTAAADQARLLGNGFHMIPVAYPTRRRQGQHGFIDGSLLPPPSPCWTRKR